MINQMENILAKKGKKNPKPELIGHFITSVPKGITG